MELVLKDGTTLEVEDTSWDTCINIAIDSFAEVDVLRNIITEDNYNGGTLKDHAIPPVKFINMQIFTSDTTIDHLTRVAFQFELKSKEDILEERLADAEEALNFLLMGGE